MNRSPSIFCMCLVVVLSLLFVDGPVVMAQKPAIHIAKTAHDFATVFEGDELSYTFKAVNRGSADLIIEDVTTR